MARSLLRLTSELPCRNVLVPNNHEAYVLTCITVGLRLAEEEHGQGLITMKGAVVRPYCLYTRLITDLLRQLSKGSI